jgi:hypothetical protein
LKWTPVLINNTLRQSVISTTVTPKLELNQSVSLDSDTIISPRKNVILTFPSDMQIITTSIQFNPSISMSSYPYVYFHSPILENNSLKITVCTQLDISIEIPAGTVLGNFYATNDIQEQYCFLTKSKVIKKDRISSDWLTGLDIPQAMLPLLNKYRDKINSGNYSIKLPEAYLNTGKVSPIYRKPYKLSEEKRRFVSQQIQQWMADGIAEVSNSPWASPCVVVPKSIGDSSEKTWRLCGDYTGINKVLQTEHFPLPRISDLIFELRGSEIFTIIDLKNAYLQIPLAEKDKEKTAIVTPDIQFHFKYMPFGLTLSASVMQRVMFQLFGEYRNKFVVCYQDDICIYSKNVSDHLEHVSLVLNRLSEAGLLIAIDKSKFFRSHIPYLGFIVSGTSVSPNKKNIEAVLRWQSPKNAKETKSILAAASFYRSYVQDFAKKTVHMRALSKKDSNKWIWTDAAEAEFKFLKHSLTNPPVLSHFMPGMPTVLKTDASSKAIGSILIQTQNGKDHVIAYASCALSNQQQRWSIIEKECYSIKWATQTFSQYLDNHKFTLLTDSHSLCYLFKLKTPNPKLARWAMDLQDKDMEIKFIPGSKHCDVDCLSRHNYVNTLVSNNAFVQLDNLLQQQNQEISQNSRLKQSLTFNSSNNVWVFRKRKSRISPDGLDLIFIPNSLVPTLLHAAHCDALSGHFGINKLWYKLRYKYYWPQMYNNIKSFVQSCKQCQLRKIPNQVPAGKLQTIQSSTPMELINIDYVGPISRTRKGNEYLIVAIDHFTKWAFARPVKNPDAASAAKFILEEIVLQFSSPSKILSDRGQAFLSNTVAHLLALLDIKKVNTTSYRPQCNGNVEIVNKTLIQLLSKTCLQVSSDQWDDFVPYVLHQYNTTIQDSIQMSPYEALLGIRPTLVQMDLPILSTMDNHQIKHIRDRFLLVRSTLNENLKVAREKQKLQYDLRRRDDQFTVDERILLYDQRIKQKGKKLDSNYLGPFKVLKRLGPLTYSVERESDKVTRVVNVQNMVKFNSPGCKFHDPATDTDISRTSVTAPQAESSATIVSPCDDDGWYTVLLPRPPIHDPEIPIVENRVNNMDVLINELPPVVQNVPRVRPQRLKRQHVLPPPDYQNLMQQMEQVPLPEASPKKLRSGRPRP